MASKILNILSRTTQVSTEELLQGVIHATMSAIEIAQANNIDKPQLLEMINFMCEIIDGQSNALKEEYMLHIVDDICLVLLPGIEVYVFGSHSKHIGIHSQLHQSLSRLLSLCTVAETPAAASTSSVRCRLLEEYLSALTAYKNEVEFSIVGDRRALVTIEKHLCIQTIMEVISTLLDRKAKAAHVQTNDHKPNENCQSISSEWIQRCFDSILEILQVCQANVCSRLAGVILPKILQIEPHLTGARCDHIWKKVNRMYTSSSSNDEINTNVFITLCGLVNYFIPCSRSTQDNSHNKTLSSIISKVEFWHMIQSGLIHSDLLARKQAMFLLKRAIDWCSVDSATGLDMKVPGGDMLSLFQWTSGKRKQLLSIWDDFFLLYETLAEIQVHVVRAVMPRLGKLIKAASCTHEADGHPLLHPSWLTVIFHRSFTHETKTVVKWGVSKFLRIDLTTCHIMHHGGTQFVLDFVMDVFLDDGLFIRQPNQPLGVCLPIVSDLKAFLHACVKVLPHTQLKAFLHDFLATICGKKCGPVAITFAMEALAELPRVPVWDEPSIKTIRQFLNTGLIGLPTTFRCVIKCFVLKSALNLLDTTTISVQHFSELLSTFSSDVCWGRGLSTWNEVCEWVLANRSTHLFNLDDGAALQNSLSNQLVALLTVEDENSELPRPAEAGRVARLLMIITDAHQISMERGTPLFNVKTANTTSIIAAILQPLSDVLVRISSHIYLSQTKADKSLQVLLAILLEIQPGSTLFGSKEDPTKKDFEDMMILCTEEVLTYLTRKLQSQQILQTDDLERVNFYIATLDAIYTFWHERFTDSTQRSYQQISILLRNTKAELTKSILSAFETAEKETISVENQGKKVIFTSILLWLSSSSLSSGNNSTSNSTSTTLLDSLLSIQSVTVKSLPPPQNGQLVSTQDWGRIQSRLLQCKWSCILVLMSEDRTDDVDVLYVGEMCAKDLQVVSGTDYLSIMKCATIIMEQLLSLDASACVDLIETSWCIVQDNWKSLDFWPVYIAFVKLTFQNCLMQPEMETAISDTIGKYTSKIFELGETRHGIVNTLISHICKTWSVMLTQSEESKQQVIAGIKEYTQMFQKACLFGPIYNKGDRLIAEVAVYLMTLDQLDVVKSYILARRDKDCGAVRATALNFLLQLGMHQREDLNAYLGTFLVDLLSKDLALDSVRKPYIINSLIHRQKQRTWQTILVLMPWLREDASGQMYDMTMQYLKSENQTSVRSLMVWVLVRLLYRFPDLHSRLWADLHVVTAGKCSNVCPLLIVTAHLAAIQPTIELKEAFYMKAVPVVMPWSLAQPQSLRTHGQLALYKLWKDCTEQGLTRILDTFPAVSACMQFQQNHSTLLRLKEKIEEHYFVMGLHPIEDYSIETIFHTLPVMSYVVEEELIEPSLFEYDSPVYWSAVDSASPLTLYNKRSDLKHHRQLQLKYRASKGNEQVDVELHDKDVQKKIIPSKDIPGLEGLILNKEENKPKGSLILVATLIDKPTNLGGLCRTSEIFGVSKLIIGNYRYMEDKQFTNLSVTADKWMPIEEVKPNDLAQYLSDMRHDGYTLVGVEQTANSSSLTDYQFPERTLLLLGNERGGIPVELIQLLDICVEIPQLGMVRSLNVHVSGALLVWEYTRQRLLNIR